MKINDIRNVAVVGHSGSGKTTLSEGLAFKSGFTDKWHKKGDSASIFDYQEDERERGTSLNSAILQGDHAGKFITIIDCPGAPDFYGDTLGAIESVETVIIVVAANQGLGVTTRRVWANCEERNLPRAVVVTKADAANVKLFEMIDTIRKSWGQKVVPITIASGEGEGFSGIEEAVKSGDDAAKTALMDSICEADDELMMRYMDGEEISDAELAGGFTKAMVKGTLIPLYVVGESKDIGYEKVLKDICDGFPSPADVPLPKAFDDAGAEMEISVDGPVLGRMFKSTLAVAGRVSYIRVYSGSFAKDSQFCTKKMNKAEKLPPPQKIIGKDLKDGAVSSAGGIFAVLKLEDVEIGDTLSAPKPARYLAPIPFAKPMVMLAVEPLARKDADKINEGLRKLSQTDPTFRAQRDETTGDLVVYGTTNQHLLVMLDRLKKRFKVECTTKKPRIPYRETITSKANVRYRHKKQSGGSGEFGEIELNLYPADKEFIDEGEDDLQFVSSIVGTCIDRNYVPSVEKGVRDQMTRGVIAGYPVINVKVELVDGKQHPVDSKDAAFQKAGKMAFKWGCRGQKGVPTSWNEPNRVVGDPKPTLLEPIVSLEVNVPVANMGDILSDVNRKRGQVLGQDMDAGYATIKAKAPLAEVLDYANDLQKITAGEGSFTMEFLQYDQVPPNIAEPLIKAARAEEEEDE
ncbi:MAG: elongation factor G [Planctomycetes bacterium]|nr:elongation factor G [Planctomycetota bacterium]